MKILHINAGSLNSGSGRGVYWLHQALLKNGVKSKILCSEYDGTDENVITPEKKNTYSKKIEKLLHKYVFFASKNFHTNHFGLDVKKYECYKWADIIHLHWINGLIGNTNISCIDKPIVWTLRDMWALTGGCFYSLDCDKWKKNCIQCPEIGSKLPVSLINQTIKKEKFDSKIVYVAISDWLRTKAKESSVLKNNEVLHIPNSIDLELFSYDEYFKQRFPFIKDNDFVISVGAQNLKDIYKGGAILIDLLNAINFKTVVLCFGNSNIQNEISNKHIRFFYLGFVDDNTICSVYSASNVFLMTSTMEAFGKTVVESLACGTPVICFDKTAPAEIITSMKDGIIVNRNSIPEFMQALLFIKLKKKIYFFRRCVQKSKQYDSVRIAKEYSYLYQKIYVRRF